MSLRVPELSRRHTPPASPLDAVLRRVNRLRLEHGVDPLYELPTACTAWGGGGCVLERAFEDLGVLVVDYRHAYGRHVKFEHGLRGFICDFDAGRYPELVSGPEHNSGLKGRFAGASPGIRGHGETRL